MKNWQKDRNYRKYKNADGSFTYIITVDGEDVQVTPEVYRAYSQADRRERYCSEREEGLLLSLERFAEDNVLLSYLTKQHVESAEDTAIRAMLTMQALTAIGFLEPGERRLIWDIVMNGVTEQECADRLGVSQVAVHKRKKRILKKILNLMVIKPSDFREGK